MLENNVPLSKEDVSRPFLHFSVPKLVVFVRRKTPFKQLIKCKESNRFGFHG